MADCRQLSSCDILYENDLALAAELGKALLERNRDLETEVYHLQQLNDEYKLENHHLNRQLEALKDINDSRMRVYDELDKNAQELEAVNRQLRDEIKGNRAEIDRRTKRNKQLEADMEELHNQLEEVRAIEINRLTEDRRKTQSVPSVQDAVTMEIRNVYRKASNWADTSHLRANLPKNPYEDEIEKLQNDLGITRAQLAVEKSKHDMLETDLIAIVKDNQILEAKVVELRDSWLQAKAQVKSTSRINKSEELCAKCALELCPPDRTDCFATEVEHDDPQVGSEGKFVKLGDGGSIYGSDESINKVVSESGEIVVASGDFVQGVPILNELDAQYNALISKYESLISNLTKRASGDFDDVEITPEVDKLHKDVQSLLNTKKSQPPKSLSVLNATTSCQSALDQTKHSPPTYKYLFKDIYATLEKSHSIGDIPAYKNDSNGGKRRGGVTSPTKSPKVSP